MYNKTIALFSVTVGTIFSCHTVGSVFTPKLSDGHFTHVELVAMQILKHKLVCTENG